MPWYSTKHPDGNVELKYGKNKSDLLFSYIEQKNWQVEINLWHPKKLDYKTLLIFYEEIQNALASGLQLREAIKNLAQSSTNNNLSSVSKALLSELERGVYLNDALGSLSNQHAKPYSQLINSHGAREDCDESLSISISQLKTVIGWSQRLMKAITYPFCIIQVSLLINLLNSLFLKPIESGDPFRLLGDITAYFFVSLIQAAILLQLHSGNASHWLEKCSSKFRLTKLFSLLVTAKKTGRPLQHVLKFMPTYFNNRQIQGEIVKVYYLLRLGKNYTQSFPSSWFPDKSAIALSSSEKDGDIERALMIAQKEHEAHWQKQVILIEKIIPAISLFIAGTFVASVLISLYSPLLDVQ